MARFKRRLESYEDSPRGTLLMGVRGTGKSALLNEFHLSAQEHDWIVARKTLTFGLNSKAELGATYSEQARDIADEVFGLERIRRLAKSVREGITLEIPLEGGSKVSFRLSGSDETLTLDDALLRSLRRLGEGARDDSRLNGVAFIYDEMQRLRNDPENGEFPLSALLNAFTDVQAATLPVMLVVGGLPQLRRQIADAQENAPRGLDAETLLAFSLRPEQGGLLSEAAQALVDIGATQGIEYDPVAAEQMAADAVGYPAGLQALGYRLVEAALCAGTTTITEEFYGAHRPAALAYLHEQLYLGDFERTTPAQRRLLIAAAELDRETFGLQELAGLEGVEGLVAELRELGVVCEPEPDQFTYVYGGFGRFLSRQRSGEV